MIPYRDEKIIQAIYFFADQHKKMVRKYLYQTFLYKYLAFFDFRSLEETGEPALGLHYLALEHGPVPDEIYNSDQYKSTDLYKFQKDNYGTIINPLPESKPNYDCFSKYEINLLGNLIEIFASEYVSTNMACEASHEAITAWRRTWKKNPNSMIKYIDDFPGELLKKSPEKLSDIEQHFLIFSTINHLS